MTGTMTKARCTVQPSEITLNFDFGGISWKQKLNTYSSGDL